MDAMKEAFKRHISKHMVKGKPVPGDAEDPTHHLGKDGEALADNDPNKMTEHAPELQDAMENDSMMMESPEHEAKEENLMTIFHKALMNAGSHMGRGAMSLNEKARDHHMMKMKK